VDEDAPHGFRDFARNDTVESVQRSKPFFSSLHNACLLLPIIYSGQQCAKAGIQAALLQEDALIWIPAFAGMTKSWACALN